MQAVEKVPRQDALSIGTFMLDGDPAWVARYKAVRAFAARVRTREYHLTNACNIRCEGCWFFEFGHDRTVKEVKAIDSWERFVAEQRRQRVNAALLIGGEPTMFLDRIALFTAAMRFVTISTNGYKKLPYLDPFKRVGLLVSMFGGGPLDDQLRAIKPSGRRFTGLFDTALKNYEGDPRATFVFAVTERSTPYIMDTVRRIRDNGNIVTFNFYSEYNTGHPLRKANSRRLLNAMREAKSAHPETVASHAEHIAALITGSAWCGSFSGNTCPSISRSHPDNAARVGNGHPFLPFFETYKADLATLEKCCTSGHCDDCRDSQAVYSWQLVSLDRALTSKDALKTWIEVSEAYWSQFIWTPFHRAAKTDLTDQIQAAEASCEAEVAEIVPC